jgi:hypothetical protein
MYTSSSIIPLRKVVFTSIRYIFQPKIDAKDMIALIELYLGIGAKVFVIAQSVPWAKPNSIHGSVTTMGVPTHCHLI